MTIFITGLSMTRIRYFNIGTKIVSSNPIVCGTKVYTIEIDINKTEASIREHGNNRNSHHLQASTLTGLKKRIRNTLIQLGAKFTDEIRNSRQTKRVTVK